jgi:hypothetical protein
MDVAKNDLTTNASFINDILFTRVTSTKKNKNKMNEYGS